jgi:signal transduction histidine kinase
VYALSPETPDAFLRDLVPGRELVHLSRADELRGRPPGLLLLPVELPPDQVVAALTYAAASPAEAPWLPVLVERASGGGPGRAIPISLGWSTSAEELSRWAAGEEDPKVLELRHVLARVARARHDLNNPLTSAMAETQLALLDATEPAVRSGLETIEEQLRRIRDLVAGLRVFRPPAEGRRS